MSDANAPLRNARLTDRQLRGVSIPFLGTNNQVYCDEYLLRQKPSAKSDFCRGRLDAFGRNGDQNREHTFSRYHMKLSENESLHQPDHEMVCDRNFSAALSPTEVPKVRVMTSQVF